MKNIAIAFNLGDKDKIKNITNGNIQQILNLFASSSKITVGSRFEDNRCNTCYPIKIETVVKDGSGQIIECTFRSNERMHAELSHIPYDLANKEKFKNAKYHEDDFIKLLLKKFDCASTDEIINVFYKVLSDDKLQDADKDLFNKYKALSACDSMLQGAEFDKSLLNANVIAGAKAVKIADTNASLFNILYDNSLARDNYAAYEYLEEKDLIECGGNKYIRLNENRVEFLIDENETGDISIPSEIEYGKETLKVSLVGKLRSEKLNCSNVNFEGDFDKLEIVEDTFTENINLKSVKFENVKELQIDSRTFEKCTNLESVQIVMHENDMNKIDIMDDAFQECSSLTTFEIKSSKLNDLQIGNQSFQECKALQSFITGNNVVNMAIGKAAFKGCKKLMDFGVQEGDSAVCADAESMLIDESAFKNCSN